MSLTDTTLDVIKDDLVAGIAQSNLRRRRRQRMLAVAPVLGLILAGVVIFGFASDDPAYALTQRADGEIRVEVFPEFDDVEDLEAELSEAGLDVTVVHLQSHESLSGVVEVVSHDNTASGAAVFDDGEFVIEDPSHIDGLIEILIYTPADRGEDYQASPSIFAPDQPLEGLHCAYADRPLPTADLEARAIAAGIAQFNWIIFGEINEDFSIDVETSEELLTGFVENAVLRNSTTLDVFVTVDSAEPGSETIVMHDGTHSTDHPTCADALAEPWQ